MANPSIQLGTNSNWAIKEDKLLAYKEYNDYFFNKEFDFSRGTSATYVAKDGLVKTAGIQPNIVNNGDFSELGSELITNGDFSDGSSGWVAEGGGSTWIIDNGANKISSSNFALYQNITRTVGKIYKISFDIVEYTSGVLNVSLGNGASTSFNTAGSKTIYKEWDGSDNRVIFRSSFIGKIDNISVKEVGQNWTVANEDANNYVEFNQEEGTVRLKFLNTSPITTLSSATQYLSGKTYKLTVDVKEVVSGSIKVDAAGVNETFNSVGIQQRIIEPTGNATINFYRASANVDITLNSVSLQEIQTDTPRIDFTNDTKGHLLLEPQSTNLITYSEDFSQWGTVNGAVVTDNFITSPDGSQNAAKVVYDGTSSGRIEISTAASGTNTQSIYLKTASGTQAVSIGASSGSLTEVTVTSEWQRFTHTGSGNYPRVLCNDAATIYVWGGQLESGDYATSYIPTTGAASTRNADVCNNSGSAQDFNSEEGVLYWEAAALNDDVGSTRVLSISDGTNSNTLYTGYNSSSNVVQAQLVVGGVAQTNMLHTVSDRTDFLKVAVLYQNNNHKMYINGVEVSVDTSGSVPSANTFDRLNFDLGQSSFDFYGKVRNLQVFTEALTDAELQELTS